MAPQADEDSLLAELQSLGANDIIEQFGKFDAAAQLSSLLSEKYPPEKVAEPGGARVWELAGSFFLRGWRYHEALGLFFGLYYKMIKAQSSGRRVHKGMPLVYIAECFRGLNFPVHAKRYLMLTLCEDALHGGGVISDRYAGMYFRLVWLHGLPHEKLQEYAARFCKLEQASPFDALFPEALLQQVDNDWLTEVPAAAEALTYHINAHYVRVLLEQLGGGTGRALEILAEYLMSCMPGCRTRRRARSHSTDYDIICAMEGSDLDFRSELGRYFVCECKDWQSPANFEAMAKFCRILDSTKSRFGILFSKNGISGVSRTEHAAREQLKVFQDRGVVIVVVDKADLEEIALGANLIGLLRKKYERVRLDLHGGETEI